MSMIERVAAAMAADGTSEGAFFCGDNKAGWMALARIAIETLRQPTNEMLRAVDNEDEDAMVARGRAYSAWLSMLDAALTDPHINSIMGVGK